MTYDFFYRELESTEIIWNLQWHIFLALKKNQHRSQNTTKEKINNL